jgi:RHS repeat-associated protein
MKPDLTFNTMVMRIKILLFFLLASGTAISQTHNTVQSWAAQKPISTESDIMLTSHPVQEVIKTTQYMDGFNRMVQAVTQKTSPAQQDAVEMHVYDTWGREVQRYLPFVSGNNGSFKTNAQSLQTSFYQGLYPGETNFYSRADVENSPLNRILKSYDPGSSWNGSNRGSSVQFMVSTITDNVQIWTIGSTTGSIPTRTAAYGAGQLYKSVSTDEKGVQAIEYSDKDGQIILRKTQLSGAADNGSGTPHNGWSCTYYVYDDYTNLRFILTPKLIALIDGTWSISQANADELCYRFEYDDFNRIAVQKSPGTPSGIAGEVWTVYDQRGRVVMKQDGNLRSLQKWQYFQYDVQDRATATGFILDANNRNYHQGIASGQINYPNLGSYSPEVLAQTYYDNYSWVAATGSGIGSSLDQSNTSNTSLFYSPSNSTAPFPQAIIQTGQTRGFVTGKRSEVLGTNGTQYIYTVNFFDNKGRIIQSQSNNSSGTVDKATTQYSWKGIPLRIYEQHSKTGVNSQHAVLTKMSYDHTGRLLSVVKNISSTVNGSPVNSGDKTIATYTYKETGQLNIKAIGNGLESQVFDYNVRGWLTGINKNYTLAGNTGHFFGEELGYDKVTTTAGTTNFLNPTYNGAISGQVWRSKGDGITRKYDFNYDNQNQLSSAPYLQNTSGSAWDKTYMDYSVNSMSYDLNGNIKSLNQNGFVLGGPPNIDNLGYNYLNNDNSNRLQNVIDNSNIATSKIGDFHYAGTKTPLSTDYVYDNNGNLTSDVNKGISSIAYNELNLPKLITFTKGTLSYQYDASGNKLKKTTVENAATVVHNGTPYTTNITTVTTYIGGFVYQSKTFDNPNLSTLNQPEGLQFTAQEEGRMRLAVLASGALGWVCDYFIRDHLGNVRATVTDESQTDTYPSATLETAGITSEQKYYNITNDPNHVITASTLPWWSTVTNNTYNNGNGLAAPPDPTVNPGSSSTKLYKLNGNTGDRFGMGIALKVMAGDVISIYGRSVWHNGGSTNNGFPVSGVINSFLNAIAGTDAVIGGTKGVANGATLNANPNTTGPLTTLLNNVPTPGNPTPKAYINWILFDDQFKPVPGANGADPVYSTADYVKPHSIAGLPLNTSGYLYVYCSNESNQDVYFDNLQVVHTRGALVEERQYYPNGLSMFFLSSRASGKLQTNFGYQGKEMQNGEFYDGSGLEEYDFASRYYDPQLGRWWNQDPAGQFASPYNAMGNNWPNGIDPNGKWFGWDDIIVAAIGFLTGYLTNAITTGDWGWRSVKAGFISAAMFELGYYTAGAGAAGISQGGIANIFSSAGFQAQANTVGLAFAGRSALVSVVGSLIPGINIPIGNNFSIGISPALAVSGGQLTTGFAVSANYQNGDLSLSAGLAQSGNTFSWGGSAMYAGFGGSYAHNKFNGEYSQKSVTLGVYAFGASLRVDEDYMGDKLDRWRTGAVELGINNFVVGLSVLTNDGEVESKGQTYEGKSPIYKENKTGKGAWTNGQVWHSPAWIGYRSGNQVTRVGFSHREVQDAFQNGLHQNWFPTPYYLNYDNFTKGLYNYTGFYNPFTLY